MHSTIWFDAFRRQLFAIYSGSFPKGFISEIPIIKKKIMKNTDCTSRKESNDPANMIAMGAKNEKETAPEGVMSRCDMLMFSSISGSFFLSGFIFSIFSLRLHNFSYIVRCCGIYSCLNSWYSLEVIFGE